MWFLRLIKNIIRSFNVQPKTDPMYICDLYKDKGCVHLDGFLCNLETCKELKEYRILKEKRNER